MQQREFNKVIRAISVKGQLSLVKAKQLPTETRDAVTKFIIRNRGPVLTALLPDQPDWQWLHGCAYLHRSVSKKNGLEFIHTSEHLIH